MKVAAVSADLLIKLALVAGGIGLAWYALGRLQTGLASAAKGAGQAVSQVADAVIVGLSPTDPGNLANRSVNALGGILVSDTGPGRNADGSWNLGSWWYDLTKPAPLVSSPPFLPPADLYDTNHNLFP